MSKPLEVVTVLAKEIEAAFAWRLRTGGDSALKMLDANDALSAVAELIAERDALAERVKGLEEAMRSIERRTLTSRHDTSEDRRRDLVHANGIAKQALARAEASKPEGGAP